MNGSGPSLTQAVAPLEEPARLVGSRQFKNWPSTVLSHRSAWQAGRVNATELVKFCIKKSSLLSCDMIWSVWYLSKKARRRSKVSLSRKPGPARVGD